MAKFNENILVTEDEIVVLAVSISRGFGLYLTSHITGLSKVLFWGLRSPSREDRKIKSGRRVGRVYNVMMIVLI